jgi:hypothetical protein
MAARLAENAILCHLGSVPIGVSPLFRNKAIAAFATIACVFVAQQGTAGNAEYILARPTLMVLPMAAIAPVAVMASATAEAAVFDYDSPARQIVFPVLEEQMLKNEYGLSVPLPTFKPTRNTARVNPAIRSETRRGTGQLVRAKAEPKRIASASVIRFTGVMQPIIGAFR